MAIIAIICGVKEYRLSSATPKILELLIVGISMPSIVILRSSLYSFVQFVNMVAVDLVRESVRPLTEKKREQSVR